MSPIADMLTQLKNAQARGHNEAVLPFSKMKFAIVSILQEKGFVESVEKKKKKTKKSEFDTLSIKLKYNNGVGAIDDIKLISKPSRRIYAGSGELKSVRSGYGISVVSTSKGVMSGENAKKAGLGGEVLFEIW